MPIRRGAMLIAAFALLVAACGGGEASDAGAASDDAATTTTATETTVGETTTTAGETTTTVAPETTTTVAETTTTVAGDTLAFSELDSAFEKTGEIQAARMEGSILMVGIEGLPSGSELAMPFSGAFDNATGAFSFTMDLSGIASAAGDEIPPGFEDMFSEMEIRTIGDVAYMRFPFFSAFLGVETDWIKIPADEAGSAAGGFSGGVSPTNPTGSLDAFRDANATVSELGREEVRGVETTRYLVMIDMQELLATATPEERAELEAQGPLPFDELPLQLWIGDDDLIYRYVMDISGDSVEAAPGEGFERMTMTFEMYDYGASIEIEAPPAEDVTDAEELGGLFDF